MRALSEKLVESSNKAIDEDRIEEAESFLPFMKQLGVDTNSLELIELRIRNVKNP